MDREQTRQDQQEENYSFVWGQDPPTPKESDSDIDTFPDPKSSVERESSGVERHSGVQDHPGSTQDSEKQRDSFLNKEDEES